MIDKLCAAFVNGQINVLGALYTFEKRGKHFVYVVGGRGCRYILSTSPRCTVVEGESLEVYTITACSGAHRHSDFTFFDGNTVPLFPSN